MTLFFQKPSILLQFYLQLYSCITIEGSVKLEAHKLYIKETPTCEEHMFRKESSLHLALPCHFPSCNDYLSAALKKEDLKESFSFSLLIHWYPGDG